MTEAEVIEQEYWTWTVKASGEWELEILGVPFGGPLNGKDRQKEYFDIKSQIHQHIYPEIPVTYFHALNTAGAPTGDPVYIGKARYDRMDSRGHWYRVVLDKTSALAARVWEAAKKGMAAASSETLAHLARVARDGHIENWPVAGMAVLDVADGRVPVNSYAVALPAMKAIYRDAGIEFPAMTDPNLPEAEQAAKRARKQLILNKAKEILKRSK
jgi:hypothetical protein